MEFFIILAVMFGFFWLLLIRPQRQQQRRHDALVANLKPGDEVVTNGGIYGDIAEVHDDRVSLEVAEDVWIEVAKPAIARIIPSEEATQSEAADEPEIAEGPEAVAEPAEPVDDAEPVAAEEETAGRQP
jgi:preprotein translocase subunit YajC